MGHNEEDIKQIMIQALGYAWLFFFFAFLGLLSSWHVCLASVCVFLSKNI